MWDERKELNMSARQFLFFQQADAWRFTFSMMVNTQSRTEFVGKRVVTPVQMEVTIGYLNTIV